MHLKVPAGFGGRLRGKGPGSAFVNPGPRRAAHPVHESPATTRVYLHADMALKEQALSRLAPDGAPAGRYTAPDSLLAFLDTL